MPAHELLGSGLQASLSSFTENDESRYDSKRRLLLLGRKEEGVILLVEISTVSPKEQEIVYYDMPIIAGKSD